MSGYYIFICAFICGLLICCVWLFAAFCCPQKDVTDSVTDTAWSGTEFPLISLQ
jgi:hypothetical protein